MMFDRTQVARLAPFSKQGKKKEKKRFVSKLNADDK